MALCRETRRQAFCALARSTIDDAASASVPLQKIRDLATCIRFLAHRKMQVWPVKGVQKQPRRPDKQFIDDVLARGSVGRRGERQRAHRPQLRAHAAEGEIVGPEIVTPLRYAMGLIDGKQPDAGLAQERRRVCAR